MSTASVRALPILLFCAGAVLTSAPNAQGKVRHFPGPSRVPLIAPVVLDFETEDDFVTPLENGRSISSPGEFGIHVSISGAGANLGPAIFDSTPGGPNDPSQDVDLLIGHGNLLILQNTGSPAQSAPDTFARPNDDQDGGQLIFDFVVAVEPLSIVLVDIDAGSNQATSVTLRDENGRTRVYAVPPRWTRDIAQDGPPGFGVLDLATLAPQPGFLSTATATEQSGFDASRVTRLVVALGSSGAVDDLTFSPGRSLGLVADSDSHRVFVFDADLDLVLTVVTIPTVGDAGDCLIDRSRRLGFVTDFENNVWVIDLSVSPAVLASGINPIGISNPGEDLALSPDGRFLAVSDGSALEPLSIVDLDTRLEVGTASTGSDCNSIDFCDDQTLVGSSANRHLVVGFSLAGNGTPSLNGDSATLSGEPNNVYCAPGGNVGVAIMRTPARVSSFRIDGLVPVALHSLDFFGLSACFSKDGQRLFIRERISVQARSFDPFTGVMSAAPLYTFPAESIGTYFGMERIALHPDGTRLYVPGDNTLRIHDPASGALLNTVLMVGLTPAGIAVERGL